MESHGLGYVESADKFVLLEAQLSRYLSIPDEPRLTAPLFERAFRDQRLTQPHYLQAPSGLRQTPIIWPSGSASVRLLAKTIQLQPNGLYKCRWSQHPWTTDLSPLRFRPNERLGNTLLLPPRPSSRLARLGSEYEAL